MIEQVLNDFVKDKIAEAIEPLLQKIKELEAALLDTKTDKWLPVSELIKHPNIKIQPKTIAAAGRQGRIQRIFQKNSKEDWAYNLQEVLELQQTMKGRAGKRKRDEKVIVLGKSI